jgi:hypothetical protein
MPPRPPIDPDSRVALAEIRGDVKLILAGQQRTHDDVQEIRRTLEAHNARIGLLETDRSVREGERKGLGIGGKILWSAFSLLAGGGGVFTVLELVK